MKKDSKNKSLKKLKNLFESALEESTNDSDDLLWVSSSGRIELKFNQEDLDKLNPSGSQDATIDYLVTKTHLADQLDKISDEVIKSELSDYGAWDDEELNDHEQNLHRLVWIAANDIVERQFENSEEVEEGKNCSVECRANFDKGVLT